MLGYDNSGNVTALSLLPSGSIGVDTSRGLQKSGNQIGISDLGVTTSLINNLAVTTEKLNDLAVTTAKINDLAITTGKIADNAVTKAKIEQIDANTALGNITSSSAIPTNVSITNNLSAAGDTDKDLAYSGTIKSYIDGQLQESKSDNGYIKFANGIIMQWGTHTPSSQSTTIAFPIAFPSNVWNVMASMGESFTDSAYTDNSLYWAAIKDNLSQFTLFSNLRTSNTTVAYRKMYWQAIGN